MSYRPITDVWILARPKVKYHGAFPSGFLHRARSLLGVGDNDAVLHVCSGRIRDYPGRGLGPNDRTVDLDPAVKPDYLLDVRSGLPSFLVELDRLDFKAHGPWKAVLIDRPYTAEDADRYLPGAERLPNLNALLKDALGLLPVGGKVGVLDYLWPHAGKLGKEVAVVAVGTGRNARARWFTVWERLG